MESKMSDFLSLKKIDSFGALFRGVTSTGWVRYGTHAIGISNKWNGIELN